MIKSQKFFDLYRAKNIHKSMVIPADPLYHKCPMDSLRSGAKALAAILSSRVAVWVFFGATLALGLIVARDYGISWDEKAMYVLGEEAYNFVFHHGAYPTNIGIRYHGAWFEIIQHAAEVMLGMTYARDIFIMRHMLDYVFYWAGLVAMYALALRTFKSRGWALLASLFLFLSPRLFGHAFINARDIPTMALFIVKMLTLVYFLERPTWRRAILLGIASGLLMAIRVGGLFVPLYVLIFTGLRMLDDRREEGRIDWKHYAWLMAAYACTFVLVTIAVWPLLWMNPLGNFVDAMVNMSTAQSQSGGFYMGQMVFNNLPWHWIPVNIVTKTPLLYSVLFLAGTAALLGALWKRPADALGDKRTLLLLFLWFLLPPLVIVVLQGHLFDEWRHIYFIYPAYVLIAVFGLRALWEGAGRLATATRQLVARSVIAGACAASVLLTVWWMAVNHPLEYVYFSIPSRWVEGYFALDYWGVSYRQGFEWILAHDPGERITVQVRSSPGWENLNILTQEQRRRLVVLGNSAITKYVLDNYVDSAYQHTLPAKDEIHSIRVAGMDVLGIYRNPFWTPAADKDAQPMNDHDVQLRFDPNDMP